MRVLGQNREIEKGDVMLTPTNSSLLLGVFTSVPILVKIDQEMRPRECAQTDKLSDRRTDAHRFDSNLSHAICCSYGADNYDSRGVSTLCFSPLRKEERCKYSR